MISTCVPWNLHEIALGDFDFSGETDHSRDLVVFLELAREFGFKVILRPGPYIGAEWNNGGYPDFLFSIPEILARDHQGQAVEQTGQLGVRKGLVPCYNHPRFQNQIKRYFSALSDIVRNYTYPKGPVVMIQLDNHPSFGGNLEPFRLDYNDHIAGTLYPQFLQGKYGDIRELNSTYLEKNRRFAEVTPPAQLKINKPKQLLKYLDWIEFKEKYLADYIESLKEIFISCEIPAIFSTVLFQEKLFSVPFNWTLVDRGENYVGAHVGLDRGYFDLISHLRYYATCSRFAWACEFKVGDSSDKPTQSRNYFPVSPQETKLQLVTSLLCGIKGFNYYMFVERDHWYDSPLAEDGTLQSSYELIKRFNQVVEKTELEKFSSLAEVGLVNYRPYLWHTHIGAGKPFGYVSDLVGLTSKNIVSDLMRFGLDFGIADMWLADSLKNFQVLFIPVAEYMDDDAQRNILELARSGKTLVLFGVLPKYDMKMRSCEILCKGLKLRTNQKTLIGKVNTSSADFTAQIYGFVRRAGGKSQTMARLGDKSVGVRSKIGRGTVYLFSFDICASLNYMKLSFLGNILRECRVWKPTASNHPFTYVVPHKANRRVMLYIVRWDKGEEEKVIIQADCKRLGIKGARIRLVDLLGDQTIKTTSSELKEGLVLRLGPLDSRMYLVETR